MESDTFGAKLRLLTESNIEHTDHEQIPNNILAGDKNYQGTQQLWWEIELC